MSIRQLDPALVAAVAGHIGGIVDKLRDILEDPASALLVVIIDEGLPTDDLDPPLSPEILTGDAAPLLKIVEFEHGSVLFVQNPFAGIAVFLFTEA